MNLTYLELLRVIEQSHSRNNQPGFIPAYVQQQETVLRMPQAEQDWRDTVQQVHQFWQSRD